MPVTTCTVCGRELSYRTGKPKHCPDCQRVHKVALQRQLRRKNGMPADVSERTCVICGASFVSRRYNQKLCGDPKCKRKYKSQYDRALPNRQRKKYAPRKVKLRRKQCVECGAIYETSSAATITCSPECKYTRTRRLLKAAYHRRMAARGPLSKKCPVCGREFVYTGRQTFCCRECCLVHRAIVKGELVPNSELLEHITEEDISERAAEIRSRWTERVRKLRDSRLENNTMWHPG